ncbi:SIR2-like domain-containing protein [Bosea sp. OK403]|uniref:SIR2 family protein n=1 Tax=Bosea sp. OK403 TaxID=1855286 RepID=UPI0008ED4669|nr:SIR2 family protein [Bosea sp. OK403]SFJ04413.1 SIR2-like domain-containing protein [Bosea sp. OK403]
MVQCHIISNDDEEAAKVLAPYIQSGNLNFLIGSGASLPAIKTAGNIEKTLDELIKKGKKAEADREMVDFIEAIGETYKQLVNDTIYSNELDETINNYGRFISIVDQILFFRKNEILPRQATIYSTNYDTFIEFAVSNSPSIIINDGFDRTSGQSDSFAFAPERYFDRTYRASSLYARRVEIPTINLIKPHGSLNWAKKGSNLVYKASAVPPLTPAEKANSAKVSEYLSKHFLIMPHFGKFHETLMERVYYDLLRLFSKSMEQENAILMAFGFSFSDEHILDITKRTLRNPTSQLIIFAYSHDDIASYQAKFEKHRNVSIIGPQAGINISFLRLNNILSAVLPEMQNG